MIHAVDRGPLRQQPHQVESPRLAKAGTASPWYRAASAGRRRICQHPWSRCLHAPVTDGVAWASPEVGICHRRRLAAITALKGVSDKVMYLVRDAAALYLVTT